MSSRDALVLQALDRHPRWLDSVLSRLDGYPEPTACWSWRGAIDKGYGKVHVPRTGHRSDVVPVHRVVWLALRGSIAEGLVLDHDGPHGCHNKACANPAHLHPATNRENVVVNGTGFAAVNAAKTHCPYGHELGEANRWGFRPCPPCQQRRDTERGLLVRDAAHALGLTRDAYVAMHGKSRATAEAVLVGVSRG